MTTPHLRLDLTKPAQQDIIQILDRSAEKFGEEAADRYLTLLSLAMRDLTMDPKRPGSRSRPELAKDIHTYHLAYSKRGTSGIRVKAPRHLLIYRVYSSSLQVLRVLHDASELSTHSLYTKGETGLES